MRRFITIAIVLLFFGCIFSGSKNQAVDCPDNSGKLLNLLIMSGRNNHEWQATSPLLKKVFTGSGRFSVDISNAPDTMNYEDFSQYDVILSNWNSWPENDLRWPKEGEDGLMKFLKNGGGLVFFHASSSAFYQWPAFKTISTGAWIDNTNHGPLGLVHVGIDDSLHPVTKGVTDFTVFDELWEHAEQNPDYKVLGTAWNSTSQEKQPAIAVVEIEKGRVFHTILGHDVRAIRNSGVTTLLLRGAEWAATGDVTIPLPLVTNR